MVSALAIVWFHCQSVAAPIAGGGPPGTWLARTGFFAVDALFVLSGFAQFLPFAAAFAAEGPAQPPNWRGYAVRRVLRIVPAYYVALVLSALYVGHFSLGAGHAERVVGIWEVVIHAAFLQHLVYGVSGQEGFGINTAMWTLTAEAAFYLALPFVARRFLRHPLVGLGTAFAIAVGWRLFAIAHSTTTVPSTYLVSQVPGFAFHFALGMAAALVVVRLRALVAVSQRVARSVRPAAAFVVVWGVLVLLAWQRAVDPAAHGFSQSYTTYDRFVWNLAPTTAFAMLVVALAVAPAWSSWPLANPLSRWLGEATYGTYLVHILVMREVATRWRHLGHGPFALWQIGLMVTVEGLLLGRLSFLVVEEPARRLGRSMAARLARRTATRSPLRPGRPPIPWSPRAESTSPAGRSGAG